MSKVYKAVLVSVLLFVNISFGTELNNGLQIHNKDLNTEKKSVFFISADDSRIKIHGSKFTKMVNGEMIMHRHTDEMYEGSTSILRFNPEKAKSSTGISIRFKTQSPTIKINFKIIEEVFKKEPAGGDIGIFQQFNSISNPIQKSPVEAITPDDIYRLNYDIGKEFSIDIASNNIGDLIEYKITLPIWIDVNLLGLELEAGYGLVDYTEAVKPVYVAYGNAITHGRSQDGTYETYPYLISEWMNWELYNIAVGGGKTSKYMAEMVRDKFAHIDYMTVLIGYNDYAGAGESTDTYTENYTEFLEIIRSKHPNTKIYCLTLTATTTTTSPNSDVNAEEFRQVVRSIVEARKIAGDSNLFLIEGEGISTVDDLQGSVHFTVEGALRVADKLYLELNNVLSTAGNHFGNKKITIYPNPVAEKLSIGSIDLPNSISIFDINGLIVLKSKGKHDNIDVSMLKRGVYFVQLKFEDENSTKKFIK